MYVCVQVGMGRVLPGGGCGGVRQGVTVTTASPERQEVDKQALEEFANVVATEKLKVHTDRSHSPSTAPVTLDLDRAKSCHVAVLDY